MNDDLIIKYLLKEATEKEQLQVQDWISSSAENEKEFSRFELIWSASKKLEQERADDTDLAWDRFSARVSQNMVKKDPVRSVGERFSWLKVAAVLFIVASGWSFYSLFLNAYENIESQSLVRTEILPDGSEVTLNKNTLLSYRKNFKGNIRNVKLQSGEVFFNVSPDENKPFIIEANEITVEVVGTSFNVKLNDQGTEVIVETGIVKVSMAEQEVELRVGEKITIKDKNTILRKEANTDQLYNYYRSKVFVTDNTPLWRVVEILNEAYDANIIIENETHRNLPLNATFKDESLDEILYVITETFKITTVKEKGRIILR